MTMDARTNIKKRSPSRPVTERPERAALHSDRGAMGLPTAQIRQPSVGVVSRSSRPSRACIAGSVDPTVRGHSCGAPSAAATVATVSEANGLARPGSAGAPAYELSGAFGVTAGDRSQQNVAAAAAASGVSMDAALHLPAVANQCIPKFDVAEIFKKTPYIADLKPGGRYVAKDMFEVGGIPLLMKTLLDHGYLHGECLTATGRTIAENLKNVKWNSHQDVVRSADKPITVTGGVVGPMVKVAGMSNVKSTGPAIDAGTLNVKLTKAALAGHKTKWKPRQTNHTSGALWKYARQADPAIDGAVTHPGGSHEKQCHADI
jgi:dihydroxyacid dehydratase/phosphogluconate dehydratase